MTNSLLMDAMRESKPVDTQVRVKSFPLLATLFVAAWAMSWLLSSASGTIHAATPQSEKMPRIEEEKPAAEPEADQPAQVVKLDQEGQAKDAANKADKVLHAKYKQALLIDVSGPIFGQLHSYVNNRLDRAKAQGVDLIILRITSPGGDLEHSIELAKRLRGIDWATTIAFVPEEAISGAAIISLGCERIYMQPRALIGDAGPLSMDTSGQFQHVEEKVLSYVSTAIRELAESQGRPAAVAEAMVDRKLKVFEAVDNRTGENTFLSERDFQDAAKQANFQKGKEIPDAGQDRFLTVGGMRAVELQLAEGVFDSEQALLKQLSIDQIERTEIRWIDRFVYLLNRPWLTGLLLVIGLIGLYLEISVPGMSVAGLVSLFCFAIFFWSHALGGTSGWLEVVLFALGVTCLVFELFVFPGFGVFGVTGILLVVVSLVMASQDFLVPTTDIQWRLLRTNLLIVVGSVVGVMGLLVAQLILFDSLPGLNHFRLDAPGDDSSLNSGTTNLTASYVERESIGPKLGEQGIAESVLRPAGKARFNNQLVDVLTEGDFVDSGTPIEVIRCEGNRTIVRRTS